MYFWGKKSCISLSSLITLNPVLWEITYFSPILTRGRKWQIYKEIILARDWEYFYGQGGFLLAPIPALAPKMENIYLETRFSLDNGCDHNCHGDDDDNDGDNDDDDGDDNNDGDDDDDGRIGNS